MCKKGNVGANVEKILTETPGRRRCVTPAAILQTHGCHQSVGVGVVTVATVVAHLAADSVPVCMEAAVAHSLGDSTRDSCGETPRETLQTHFLRFDLWLFCAKGAQLEEESRQLICIRCAVCADSGQSPKLILNTAKLPETMSFAGVQIQHPPAWNQQLN